LHQAIYSTTATGEQSILKFEQDGETVFELNTQGTLLDNNIQYQLSTYGKPKNRPLPCYGAGAVNPAGPLVWDSIFSYPLLLHRSAHTHKPDYNSEEVHCAIVSSPIENISSATQWCLEYTCKNPALDATWMWRGQWVMGLEHPQTVSTTYQRNGSVIVKRIFN